MIAPRPESDEGALKVALIVGLSHSGSTMLDLTLSSHPDIVGAGEIYNFAKKHITAVQRGVPRVCACGLDVSDCELWRPVVEEVQTGLTQDERIRRTYEELTTRFRALWPGRVLLDASKKLDSITVLRGMPAVDVRVLLIARDVRGWIASSRDRHPRRSAARAKDRSGANPWRTGRRRLARIRSNSPFVLAQYWHATNRDYLARIEQLGIPFQVVSYEQLCFEPDTALTDIAGFLEVDPSATLSPSDAGSHTAAGNIVRFDPQRSSRLSYDTRWMRRPAAQVPYLLSRRLRRFNDRLVWDDSLTG